jgi:hypothetical protein
VLKRLGESPLGLRSQGGVAWLGPALGRGRINRPYVSSHRAFWLVAVVFDNLSNLAFPRLYLRFGRVTHTAGYELVGRGFRPESGRKSGTFPVGFPNVPTVLPTVGCREHSLACFSINPCSHRRIGRSGTEGTFSSSQGTLSMGREVYARNA